MPNTDYVIEILPAQPGQSGARQLSTLANTSIRSADGNATATVSAADIANYERNHGPVSANTFVIARLIPKDMGGSKALPEDMGGSKALPEDMGGSKALPEDMGGSKALPEDMGGSKALPGQGHRKHSLPKDMGGSKALPEDMGGSKAPTA